MRPVPVSDFRKQRLMDWLCTPVMEREPSGRKELAAELGTTEATLRNWQKEPEFLAAWEVAYRKSVGSPEKKQRVIDALFDSATDRDDPRQVPAAKAYLEAVDAIKPQKLEVKVDHQNDVRALTTEQLEELVAVRAARELEVRKGA